MRLLALVDPAPAAAEIAGKAAVPLFATLADLFAQARPDGVILATPNALHVEHGLACVAAGVPALIEKPLADTVEAGERLCAAAERAKVALMTGHHRQHSPIMAKAVEIVRSGRLGRLVAVAGTALFCKPDHYFDDAPWRRQPGGGPILINLIHEIGNLRALCGEIVAVQAFASNAVRGNPVEDTAAIGLRFANGALGTFLLSDTAASARSWEQTSQEDKSFPTYPDEDCYIVAGTEGSLAIPTMRLKTYANAAERSWWKPFHSETIALERADPLDRQLENFCAVIRGEAAPVVSARDGLQNVRVVDAIAQAARRRRHRVTGLNRPRSAVDQRVRLGEFRQRARILDYDIAAGALHAVFRQQRQVARQILRRHPQACGQRAFVEGQIDALMIALLVVGLQDPVRQPFGAGAQFLVLQRTHDLAVALGELADDGAGEGGVVVEHVAHGLRRNHQDLRRRQRARRFEINRVADHRRQDEGGHRPHDLDRGLVPVMGAEHFDRAVDHDVQKIRQIAFVDQRRVQREALQEGGGDQSVEIGFAHVAKQRQRADLLPIGLTQRTSPKGGFC